MRGTSRAKSAGAAPLARRRSSPTRRARRAAAPAPASAPPPRSCASSASTQSARPITAPLPWSPSWNPQPPLIRTRASRCTPNTEPVPIAAVIPSSSPSAPSAPPPRPTRSRRARTAAPSQPLGRWRRSPRRGPAPPRPRRAAPGGLGRGPRRGEDVRARTVGVGPDVGRGRRALAEHAPAASATTARHPSRPRPLPATASCDSPLPRRYQNNTKREAEPALGDVAPIGFPAGQLVLFWHYRRQQGESA